MADDALNDFFAKKDKKKATKKGGVAVPAVVPSPSNVSATAPAPTLPPKPAGATEEVPVAPRPAKQPGHGAHEDEEWLVPEEMAKDYTGLRIHALNIRSDDEEEKVATEYGEVRQSTTRKGKEKKTWAPPVKQEASSNVSSVQYPSLSATAGNKMSKTGPKGTRPPFSNGRGGASVRGQMPQLALDNKFAGLADE